MELIVSLPHLQPITCPYPKPDQSSSHFPSPFMKINFNIILPSPLRSSKWSLAFIFTLQNSLCTSVLSRTCYMSILSHSSWFDHPINIWVGVQLVKLLIM